MLRDPNDGTILVHGTQPQDESPHVDLDGFCLNSSIMTSDPGTKCCSISYPSTTDSSISV
jgi:hypothetical protein